MIYNKIITHGAKARTIFFHNAHIFLAHLSKQVRMVIWRICHSQAKLFAHVKNLGNEDAR